MRFIITMLFLFLHAGVAIAQNSKTDTTDTSGISATIWGKVTDETSEVVIGATVQLEKVDGTPITGSVTDYDGLYILTNLNEGKYNLVIQYAGMAKYSKKIWIKHAVLTYHLQSAMILKLEPGLICTFPQPMLTPGKTTTGLTLTSWQIENTPF